jgi:hypothetical protein
MVQPTIAPVPEPLRLPHGSVRGMLSLFLLVTFGVLLLRNGASGTTPAVFVNSVVVVLAFYFGSRHTPVPAQAGAPAPAPAASRLLRALLVLGFLGLGLWFFIPSPSIASLPPELLQIWEILTGYLVGLTASWYFHRHVHERLSSKKLATIFRDVSAGGVLLLTAIICAAYMLGLSGSLAARLEQVLSLVITYYFGARVIA